jgi:uncharacterized protein YqgC (DUF456 family)
MEVFLIILGVIFLVVGIIGCALPVLPGPPISYLALLVLKIGGVGDVGNLWLIGFGILAIGITLVDYLVPSYVTKRFGGSKYGAWGAGIGLAIGLFVPFVGIFVGTFLGAMIGELIYGNKFEVALKSAFGSFVGILTGTVFKLFVAMAITVYFIVALV